MQTIHNKIHTAFLKLGLDPIFCLGNVIFYNTKDFFKKHNFGRDVKRFVDKNDWCIYNNKYHLSARGIVTLGFAKKQDEIQDLVWDNLQLPASKANLESNQYDPDGERDFIFDTTISTINSNKKDSADVAVGLTLPISTRDFPLVGSFSNKMNLPAKGSFPSSPSLYSPCCTNASPINPLNSTPTNINTNTNITTTTTINTNINTNTNTNVNANINVNANVNVNANANANANANPNTNIFRTSPEAMRPSYFSRPFIPPTQPVHMGGSQPRITVSSPIDKKLIPSTVPVPVPVPVPAPAPVLVSVPTVSSAPFQPYLEQFQRPSPLPQSETRQLQQQVLPLTCYSQQQIQHFQVPSPIVINSKAPAVLRHRKSYDLSLKKEPPAKGELEREFFQNSNAHSPQIEQQREYHREQLREQQLEEQHDSNRDQQREQQREQRREQVQDDQPRSHIDRRNFVDGLSISSPGHLIYNHHEPDRLTFHRPHRRDEHEGGDFLYRYSSNLGSQNSSGYLSGSRNSSGYLSDRSYESDRELERNSSFFMVMPEDIVNPLQSDYFYMNAPLNYDHIDLPGGLTGGRSSSEHPIDLPSSGFTGAVAAAAGGGSGSFSSGLLLNHTPAGSIPDNNNNNNRLSTTVLDNTPNPPNNQEKG